MRRRGLAAALVATAIGCGGTAAAARPVTVAFALVAGEQPADCARPLGPLGADHRPAVLRDARFYVHDVALIDQGGTAVPLQLDDGPWQHAGVALVDFADGSGACAGGSAATNRAVTGTVPDGRYRGLRLTLGVPADLNHSSTELAPPPLDLAAMGWGWQAGRKFVRIEIDPEGGIARADGTRAATWFIHLGSTGCGGNAMAGQVTCMRPNRVPLAFDDFDPDRDVVTLDLAALLAGSRLGADGGGAAGCMAAPADPECDAILAALGLSPATGRPLASGRAPAFTARPRP